MIILLKDDQKISPPLVKVARFDKTTFMYTQIYTYIPEPKVMATKTSQLKSGGKDTFAIINAYPMTSTVHTKPLRPSWLQIK